MNIKILFSTTASNPNTQTNFLFRELPILSFYSVQQNVWLNYSNINGCEMRESIYKVTLTSSLFT